MSRLIFPVKYQFVQNYSFNNQRTLLIFSAFNSLIFISLLKLCKYCTSLVSWQSRWHKNKRDTLFALLDSIANLFDVKTLKVLPTYYNIVVNKLRWHSFYFVLNALIIPSYLARYLCYMLQCNPISSANQ